MLRVRLTNFPCYRDYLRWSQDRWQATALTNNYSKKKTATAVALCKAGRGLVKVNGKPLSLVEPQILRYKVYEPILILGTDKFGTKI